MPPSSAAAALIPCVQPVEIVPEPDPHEREAILAALAEADAAGSRPSAGAWARPALEEDDELWGYATARRRKSDGAPRA